MNQVQQFRYEQALDYAVQCFKSRAMSMTSDQLKTEVADIVNGTAIWNKSSKTLDYDFITGNNHTSEENVMKVRAYKERKRKEANERSSNYLSSRCDR